MGIEGMWRVIVSMGDNEGELEKFNVVDSTF